MSAAGLPEPTVDISSIRDESKDKAPKKQQQAEEDGELKEEKSEGAGNEEGSS